MVPLSPSLLFTHSLPPPLIATFISLSQEVRNICLSRDLIRPSWIKRLSQKQNFKGLFASHSSLVPLRLPEIRPDSISCSASPLTFLMATLWPFEVYLYHLPSACVRLFPFAFSAMFSEPFLSLSFSFLFFSLFLCFRLKPPPRSTRSAPLTGKGPFYCSALLFVFGST